MHNDEFFDVLRPSGGYLTSLVSVSKVPEESRKLARWWNGNTRVREGRSSTRETIGGPFGWRGRLATGSMNHFEGAKRGVDGRMSAVGISPHRSTTDTLGSPFDPSTSRGAPGYPRSMHEVIGGGFGSAASIGFLTLCESPNSLLIALSPPPPTATLSGSFGVVSRCGSLVVFDSTSALSPQSALAVLCTPFPRILLDGLSQYQARVAARPNRSFTLSWLVVPPDAHFSTTA
ncbi:hypothetical protein F5141DRAFT_1066789 [Pisolithus sp. B1]|nr:hypothetical protein F5141DRAFT_1066789 [Pisolithus sp. B1]